MSDPSLYFVPYLDEDFDLRVMHPLREQGFEVHCARDEKMLDVDDPDHLAYAVQHNWTLVTFNRGDFVELHTEYMTKGLDHAGIVVSPQIEIGRLVRSLLNLLNQVSVDEMRNQLKFLQNFELTD